MTKQLRHRTFTTMYTGPTQQQSAENMAEAEGRKPASIIVAVYTTMITICDTSTISNEAPDTRKRRLAMAMGLRRSILPYSSDE